MDLPCRTSSVREDNFCISFQVPQSESVRKWVTQRTEKMEKAKRNIMKTLFTVSHMYRITLQRPLFLIDERKMCHRETEPTAKHERMQNIEGKGSRIEDLISKASVSLPTTGQKNNETRQTS